MSMSEMEYTRLLKSVQDDLGKEFGVFRTKEEYLYLRKIVTSRIEILKSKHRYDNEIETYSDPKIRNLFSRIGNLLDSALPDRRDDVPLLPLKIESRTQYLELLNKYDELAEYLITQESVDEKFYSLLSTKLEKYYNSEDYIRRLVIRRLIKISPEFVCKKGIHGNPSNDAEGFALDSEQNRILDEKVFEKNSDGHHCLSTRLLILKQFIKQFGWCEGVRHEKEDKQHGEGFECLILKRLMEEKGLTQQMFAEQLDESIFTDLNYSERGAKDTHNFGLLKIANSFGSGYFGSNASTREDLYIFAIAFEMTFTNSNEIPEEKKEDYFTDIRKNLFYDFYNDNLFNFKSKTGKEEKNITGYGINYKNYIEICYLYSLLLKTDALSKFKEARNLITECRNSPLAKSKDDFEISNDGSDRTSYYQNNFFKELQKKSHEEAVEYIVDNYVCKSNNDDKSSKLETVYLFLDNNNPYDKKRINKIKNEKSTRSKTLKQIDPINHPSIWSCVDEELKEGDVFIELNINNPKDKEKIEKMMSEDFSDKHGKLAERLGRRDVEHMNIYSYWTRPKIKAVDYSEGNRTAMEVYYDLSKYLNNNVNAIPFDTLFGKFYKTNPLKENANENENEDSNNTLTPLSLISAKRVYDSKGELVKGDKLKIACLLAAFRELIEDETSLRDFILGNCFNFERIDAFEEIPLLRSNLMIVACQYIIAFSIKLLKNNQNINILNFENFYKWIQEEVEINSDNVRSFKGLNDLLIECGFMEVNHKNLFDLLVLYFTHQRIVTKTNVIKFSK